MNVRINKRTRRQWREDAQHWRELEFRRPRGPDAYAGWEVDNLGAAFRVTALLDELEKPWWKRLRP